MLRSEMSDKGAGLLPARRPLARKTFSRVVRADARRRINNISPRARAAGEEGGAVECAQRRLRPQGEIGMGLEIGCASACV